MVRLVQTLTLDKLEFFQNLDPPIVGALTDIDMAPELFLRQLRVRELFSFGQEFSDSGDPCVYEKCECGPDCPINIKVGNRCD